MTPIYMLSDIFINSGSGNNLFPGGTKPLPGPTMTYCRLDPTVTDSFRWNWSHYKNVTEETHLKMLSANGILFVQTCTKNDMENQVSLEYSQCPGKSINEAFHFTVSTLRLPFHHAGPPPPCWHVTYITERLITRFRWVDWLNMGQLSLLYYYRQMDLTPAQSGVRACFVCWPQEGVVVLLPCRDAGRFDVCRVTPGVVTREPRQNHCLKDGTKWPPFCRWYFPMYFILLSFDSGFP